VENTLFTRTILFALATCWRIHLGCKIKECLIWQCQ